MADLPKTYEAKTKSKGAFKKTLGKTYITFQFGNSNEGEVVAQAFAKVWQSVGQKRIYELILEEWHKLGKPLK